MARRILGLIAATAIAYGCWVAYDGYAQFQRIDQWTGAESLRWLRPWLFEFRMPLLCSAGFLAFTALSWLIQKAKIGH